MRTNTFGLVLLLLVSPHASAEDVLFEDAFKNGLSPKWQVVGLDKADHRVKDGGWEMRIPNGPPRKNPPMLKVILPFKTTDTVIVSVKVTPLDEFTADKEFAGVDLLTDGSP
jgi:hypothetical protein